MIDTKVVMLASYVGNWLRTRQHWLHRLEHTRQEAHAAVNTLCERTTFVGLQISIANRLTYLHGTPFELRRKLGDFRLARIRRHFVLHIVVALHHAPLQTSLNSLELRLYVSGILSSMIGERGLWRYKPNLWALFTGWEHLSTHRWTWNEVMYGWRMFWGGRNLSCYRVHWRVCIIAAIRRT